MWFPRGLFGVHSDQGLCENFITMDVVEIDSVASKTPHKRGISKRNPRSHNYMQLQFCSGTEKISIFQKKFYYIKNFFFAPLCSKKFFCPNLSFRHIFRCFGPKKNLHLHKCPASVEHFYRGPSLNIKDIRKTSPTLKHVTQPPPHPQPCTYIQVVIVVLY